jgi:hypothetical protein
MNKTQEEARVLVMAMLYCYQGSIDFYTAKQCALICCDRVIEAIKEYADEESLTPAIIHQLNIKKEIEKL